jgi:ribosome-associated protein
MTGRDLLLTEMLQGLVRLIVEAAEEKKAADIVIIEVGKVSLIADCFIIAEGASKTQVQAIADAIMGKTKTADYPLLHKEGYDEALWILLDYGAVVVHLFQPEQRRFYNLERLWGHAPVIDAGSSYQ